MDEKLKKLEEYNVFLYDDGSKLYFMDTGQEKILRIFYEKGEELKQKIENFCDAFLHYKK